jgi:3-phenylpropionate/trans-cinnamate dioxygenase ferredoxin reductase subunit
MSDINDIVVIGGGLAAAKAVEAVREEGFEGRVTVLADEPLRPYERPPLSKGYLVGDAEESTIYVHDDGFYGNHDIDLQLGMAATQIDREASDVVTADGSRHHYDALLIATGAQPRTLPGQDMNGVFALRSKADSDDLAAALRAADNATIIGAGWIGSEVASAARRLDTQVTIIEPLNVPLQRVLGPQVGAVFASLHRDNGVDLRTGVGLSSLRGSGAVDAVALTDGTILETDLVVVGIGVVPRTSLAEEAGLAVDNGILTDATLRTEDPKIFAAGDVARAEHPLYGMRIRVEHWANALNQGATAGRNLLGKGEVYDRLPYFYSDQYDVGLEYVGYATEWDDVVFRGNVEKREFIAFWVRNERVVAAMNCNIWDVVDDLKALITADKPVDLEALADATTPLDSLIS